MRRSPRSRRRSGRPPMRMSLWRIHAILAAYSPEEIFEKIQLMGNMGKQELRNVPGLLVYLLQENSRHIPGRARGRAASKGRTARSAGEGQPGRKRKRQAEPNPHDYLDPEQAAKLEALRDEENRRALQKELQEREEREKRKQFLISLYAQ